MARERYLLNAGEDTIHQNEIKLVTAKDKRKNWWYYNKRILAAVILVAALVIYFVYSIASKVQPDYTIALLTSYSMPDNGLKELERCITPYAEDRNGDGQVVVDVVNYAYSDSASADPTAQEAAMIRFLADASNNTEILYLHDSGAFNALESEFVGFFQYTDGTPMPDDADDFENAMIAWDDVTAFAKFEPQAAEDDLYNTEILEELFGRLRISSRAAENSSIERSEKAMVYYEDSMGLLQRLIDDEPLTSQEGTEGTDTTEEG